MRLVKYIVLLLVAIEAHGVDYMDPGEFIAQSFDAAPVSGILWLSGEHQDAAQTILGHPYRALRVRYWAKDSRSAWILDEVGKEKPITIGVVVEGALVKKVAIIAFRESRGGEVRHPFFTRQFDDLTLKEDLALSRPIDGITGATMSVNAVTNITRFALYLHGFLTRSGQQALGHAGNVHE